MHVSEDPLETLTQQIAIDRAGVSITPDLPIDFGENDNQRVP